MPVLQFGQINGGAVSISCLQMGHKKDFFFRFFSGPPDTGDVLFLLLSPTLFCLDEDSVISFNKQSKRFTNGIKLVGERALPSRRQANGCSPKCEESAMVSESLL